MVGTIWIDFTKISHYTHSGSKPCKQAASGEVPIGVSFAFRGARSKEAGAPIEIIVPAEGVGWEMEATAIIKGTSNLEAAKTLADWSISRKAMEMYNDAYAVVGMPGVAKPVKHFPEGLLEAMIKNDFDTLLKIEKISLLNGKEDMILSLSLKAK